jgi:mRNA deadenylase 3'-5' endonuclease subunit Ccr4
MRTTDIRRNAFHESKGICLSLKERKEEIMKELKISYRTRCIE